MNEDRKNIKDYFSKLKDLSTVGLGNGISIAIGGFFWIYLASIISTENYGEISYFIAIAAIAGVVSTLGAGTTVTVYSAKGEKLLRPIFSIVGISGIITSIFLFFLVTNLGVSVYIIGYVIFSILLAEFLGKKNYRNFSLLLIIQRILMVVFALLFYFLFGPEGVILGIGVSFLPFGFYLYRAIKESKMTLSDLKPKRNFMLNNYAADLSRIFSNSSDKIIIAPLFGFAILGNYYLSIQILALLFLLPSIISQYILPHEASGTANKKLKILTIIGSVVLTLVGIFLSPIVLAEFLPKYSEAIDLIQILSIAVIPKSVSLIIASEFLGREKSRIVLFSALIFIAIQIPGIIILGDFFGIQGIAISFVIAQIGESIYLLVMRKLIMHKLW